MTAVLPWVLTVLAGALLVLAVVALWQSLRAAFGAASSEEARGASVSEERAGLLDEKAALLRSIRDLELDWESGKISEADHNRLEARLRARAREVLQLLDQDVAPYRPAAQALVAEATQRAEAGSEGAALPEQAPTEQSASGAAADVSTDPGRTQEAPEGLRCPQCDAVNDADAAFCKKCGTRVPEGAGGVA